VAFVLLVGHLERRKHRIRFPRSGIIQCNPNGDTPRSGQLSRPLLAEFAIAFLIVGGGQRPAPVSYTAPMGARISYGPS